MGILLVTDILDEHRSLTDLFGKGNPLIWGGLGWCVLLLCIVLVGYQPVIYIRKYLEIMRIKKVCISEKEKNRVKIESARINRDKRIEEYRKKKKKLQEELRKRKNLVKDLKISIIKRKKLTQDIENLEKMISKLDRKIETEIAKCTRTCEELQKKVEKYEEKIENAECELEETRKNFKEKMKKRKTTCVVILLIMVTNGNNMSVAAQEVKNTLEESFNSSEELPVNILESEEPVSEDVAPINEKQNIEILPDIENELREHIDYNFILEDEQLHKIMDDEITDIIFITNYSPNMVGYKQFLIDCKEGNIIEILPKVNCDREPDLNELLYEIAEELETPFLKKINDGKEIRTQIEWEQFAPRSIELENIIDKRRQVLGMEESISIRRTIYFQLANDYQRLGKECLIQGKDGTQIYYYYGMSIYCCYCALGYEGSGEGSCSDEKILNYVKARYKDIMDNEKMGIPIEKVNSAEKMYSLLNEEPKLSAILE